MLTPTVSTVHNSVANTLKKVTVNIVFPSVSVHTHITAVLGSFESKLEGRFYELD